MTIEPSYILTQAQYDELLKAKSEPDQLLRDTNVQLKAKLDECTAKLEQGKFDHCQVDSPFIVKSGKLMLTANIDFVMLYNSLATPKLLDTDRIVFEYLTNLANLFLLEPQFANQSALKGFRVRLQKIDLYEPIRVNGIYKLQQIIKE